MKFTEADYQRIYDRDQNTCQICGKKIETFKGQIAHRIAKSKANYKAFGENIIDNDLNVLLTCDDYCNDRCNIGFSPMKCKELVEEIRGLK